MFLSVYNVCMWSEAGLVEEGETVADVVKRGVLLLPLIDSQSFSPTVTAAGCLLEALTPT